MEVFLDVIAISSNPLRANVWITQRNSLAVMQSTGLSRIAVGRCEIHGDAEIDLHHPGPNVIDELRPCVMGRG